MMMWAPVVLTRLIPLKRNITSVSVYFPGQLSPYFELSSKYGERSKFMPRATIARLRHLYGRGGFSNGMDLWVGGLAEDKLEGANLGSTFACLIGQTFSDLRSSDRFYRENPDVFTAAQRETLSKMTMAKVICENADNIPNIIPHAFEVGLDEVSCDSLPFVDLSQWKDATCTAQ